MPGFAARHHGFELALAAAGVGPAALLPVHLAGEASYRTIFEYLGDQPAPDGIVAASDVIAMNALRALAAHGRRVPQDVAVVGHDDVELAVYANPSLTTVRQDVARGAQIMVDLLFRRMAGGDVQSVLMAPELILRDSA